MNCSYNREKTSSIRTKMRPIYVRMKEFSWICLNLLEFNWINLNSWFLMFYCSLSLHFRDIWETRDGPTYRPTDGRTKPLIEMRDASKKLEDDVYEQVEQDSRTLFCNFTSSDRRLVKVSQSVCSPLWALQSGLRPAGHPEAWDLAGWLVGSQGWLAGS